jgi:transcriptional regulator with XRE-family HTH domain
MGMDEHRAGISARIASILIEKGWSNNQLGREAGIEKSLVSSILSGKANPTLETISKMETALKTPIIRVLKPKPAKNLLK